MNLFLDIGRQHWLAVVLIVLGLALIGVALFRRWKNRPMVSWLVLAGIPILLGIGGAFLSSTIFPGWLIGISLLVLFGMLLFLVMSGNWWTPLGWSMAVLLLIG